MPPNPRSAFTTWNRVEPLPSTNDFVTSLRAEIRDPLWLLARQRQMGEFRGEDTGSPAYVKIAYKTAPAVDRWLYTPPGAAPVEVDFDESAGPIEAQLLAEPHGADLATRVELGQTFFDIVGGISPANLGRVRTAFTGTAEYRLDAPAPGPFDPVDEATERFFAVVRGRAIDGFKVLTLKLIPPAVSDLATELGDAFTALEAWVKSTFGAIGTADPRAWNPGRLEYDLRVKAGVGAAATLKATPDEDGQLGWTAFDLEATAGDPFAGVTEQSVTLVPAHVRFTGMPAPRFWDFEEGSIPLPDVEVQRAELAKLVLVDIALTYGIDWFVVPLPQSRGTIARLESVVVRDVFGRQTLVRRAETGALVPGPQRWTMFSVAQPGGPLADYTVVPPSAERALQSGAVLEDVRFARDEMANMAWAIERGTESRLGDPRSGSAREAAVEGPPGSAPPPPPSTAPLRYQIESKARVSWIPFLAVTSVTRGAPALDLERGAVLRPLQGTPTPVPPLGKILRPQGLGTGVYRIPEEELPRTGVTIQRVVQRTRWTDGAAYLWVARRRLTGTGETQSGLRFDAALPTGAPTP